MKKSHFQLHFHGSTFARLFCSAVTFFGVHSLMDYKYAIKKSIYDNLKCHSEQICTWNWQLKELVQSKLSKITCSLQNLEDFLKIAHGPFCTSVLLITKGTHRRKHCPTLFQSKHWVYVYLRAKRTRTVCCRYSVSK